MNSTIQESDAILSAVVEGATDAIFVKDGQGRYLMINRAGARFLGKSAEEVVGRDDTELFPPDAAQKIMANDREVVGSGQPHSFEERATLEGVEITFLTSKVPYVNEAGEVIGLIGVSRDITERKALEDQLRQQAAALQRQAQVLTAADREKDQFLALLAHELRNPLAAIHNALYLMRPGANPQAMERSRALVERQVKLLTRLTEDLVDLSGIGRGKLLLQEERLDLTRLVRNACEDQRSTLEGVELTLSLQLPAEPVWIEGDPTRLMQVIGNLIQNATKFTDPGGRVLVTLNLNDGRARLKVRDTGIGIEPEMLPRVFERFAQVEESRERSQRGLGLGLALVKGLVELHGGEVRVDSEGQGQGAEFTILLPLAGSHET
jgi:PAS domain S-box-containing protein